GGSEGQRPSLDRRHADLRQRHDSDGSATHRRRRHPHHTGPLLHAAGPAVQRHRRRAESDRAVPRPRRGLRPRPLHPGHASRLALPAPNWLWSLALASAVRAVSLAREAELILARLADHTLALATTRGDLQARAGFRDLTSACLSEDGSAIAAAGSAGQVWWLARDLRPIREQALAAPTVAIATDPFGRYFAVSDRQGHLHLLDGAGREI